jgi:hypothetical protein
VALGKTVYVLQFIYRLNCWYLDILNTAGEYLIAAIPMVVGDNLLAQHQHIISGALYVSNSHPEELQTFDDLSQSIKLYWGD